MSSGGSRANHVAHTQATFRATNEQIEQIAISSELGLGIGLGEEIAIACECGFQSCDARIPVTVTEYEAVRRIPTRFLVYPGHVLPDFERVVEQNARYMVVEKFGEAGKVVIELDPRRAPHAPTGA